jgi:hypothetical protein
VSTIIVIELSIPIPNDDFIAQSELLASIRTPLDALLSKLPDGHKYRTRIVRVRNGGSPTKARVSKPAAQPAPPPADGKAAHI